jgi:hypothetical protein
MTTPPSLAERIDAAIRQNMLIGLQDAELYDAPGRERIGEWVDWIAQRVAETVQPELDRQAAEIGRLQYVLQQTQQAAELDSVTCESCGHLESAHDPEGDRDCDASGARIRTCSCTYFIPCYPEPAAVPVPPAPAH